VVAADEITAPSHPPIEAAATAIDIHNTASKWNKALLDNSARPSGALVYAARDGNLTVEQYDRLKAELEQGFQGAAHSLPLRRRGPAARSCSKAASTGSPHLHSRSRPLYL
jgi:hypothetical protein